MAETVGADGVGDAGKKISEGLTDIGKKLGEAFKKAIDPDAIMSVIIDVDDKTTEVIKKFGQGRDQIDNLKISMSDAVIEVTKLGGGFGNILEIQKSVSETLGRNLVISTEAYKYLYAAQEVMGPAADSLVKDLKDVGISLYQSTGEIQKIMDRAREIGVSAEKVGSQVSENLSMMNKYTFQGGVDGLAKMAAQAVNMRINIRDIGATIDKAFNPDSAIELAASLQRLGVAQSDLLDPLRLMDLAQNDPAELQNQIVEMSKQFTTLNEKGQFEIMPGAKRQMMEIESAMGMTQGSLAKMALSSAELGDKMSKIRFSDNFTEEEKTMIANMSEMSAGGEYKMSIDGKSLNMEEAMQTIGSMGEEERKSFFESQKPKDIAELAKDQLSVSKSMDASLKTIADKTAYAFAGAKSTSKVLKGAKEGSQKLAKVFDDKSAGTTTTQIREQIDITTKGLFDSFAGGKVNFEELTTTMKSFGSWVDGAFTKTWQNLEGELSGIFNFSTDKTKTDDKKPDDKKSEPVSTHVKTGDMLKMPGKNVELLPQDSIFAMTKGPEFLEKLSMLNQPMNSQTNGVVNENKNTHDITLTIKIDAGNMSETKVMEILNKTETLQALNKKLKETVTNNGLIV
jgi:hypothetical protein